MKKKMVGNGWKFGQIQRSVDKWKEKCRNERQEWKERKKEI